MRRFEVQGRRGVNVNVYSATVSLKGGEPPHRDFKAIGETEDLLIGSNERAPMMTVNSILRTFKNDNRMRISQSYNPYSVSE